MKKFIFWLIVGTLAVLFIVPVYYFLQHIGDPTFRDSAMGNWFATVIGLIVGIPIALEINRRQQAAQEAKEKQISASEQSARKEKILTLVKKELEYNRMSLLERSPKKEGDQRVVLVNSLKEELWRAFSDGGELQWVKDLELLDSISSAYYRIRSTIYLERRYLEVSHFPGMQVRQDKYPKDYILGYLTATDAEVIQSIDLALNKIEASLK